MTLMRTLENPGAGFNLYFLGYPGDTPVVENGDISHREGLLELTYNIGTETDESFHYHDGNSQPQGFGHICKLFCVRARLDHFHHGQGGWYKLAHFF